MEPSPPPTHQLPREALAKLGQTIQNKRLVRKIPALRLAKQIGVSRSYLVQLESGTFGDIGLEKFLRVSQALGLRPEQVLQEAGLIPTQAGQQLHPADYLRETYNLSPESIRQAIDYLDFLRNRELAIRKESQ